METVKDFEILWNFMCLSDTPEHCDYILCLGSLDKKVPAYAAKLWHQGFASIIIMSGGIAHQNDLAKTPWQRSEAEVFADIAIANGIKKENILIENKAGNTAENFQFSEQAFQKAKKKTSNSIMTICKPYMARRARNTGMRIFPDKKLFISSEAISFKDSINSSEYPETELQLMLGDMHRIMVYPNMGFMIKDKTPSKVETAFITLVNSGYNKHLIRGAQGNILPW